MVKTMLNKQLNPKQTAFQEAKNRPNGIDAAEEGSSTTTGIQVRSHNIKGGKIQGQPQETKNCGFLPSTSGTHLLFVCFLTG